jgi:hypothetical protein
VSNFCALFFNERIEICCRGFSKKAGKMIKNQGIPIEILEEF